MWDVQSGKKSGQMIGEQWRTNSLFFSPNSKYIINTGHGKNATIEIWDARTKRLTRTLKENRGDIFAAIRPDGKTLVSVGTGAAKVWDLQTGKLLKTWLLSGKNGAFGYVIAAISPNAKIAAFGKSQRIEQPETIELWDIETGKLLHTVIANKGYTATVNLQSLSFSRDSKILAASSAGKGEGVKLWDVRTKKLIHTYVQAKCVLTNILFR